MVCKLSNEPNSIHYAHIPTSDHPRSFRERENKHQRLLTQQTDRFLRFCVGEFTDHAFRQFREISVSDFMTIKGVEETSSRASDSGEFSLQAGIQIFALRSKLRNPCQCLLNTQDCIRQGILGINLGGLTLRGEFHLLPVQKNVTFGPDPEFL